MDLENLKNNPEQVKALIEILSSLIDSNNDNNNENDSATKSKSTRKKSSKKYINKFEKMPEYNAHKEDIAIDKKLAKYSPVDRMREAEFVQAVCRICGKKENISSSLVFEPTRYKCNNCSTQAC